MFCMKCGTQLPDDAAFCYKCGNKIIMKTSEFVQAIDTGNENKDSSFSEGVNFVVGDATVAFSKEVIEYKELYSFIREKANQVFYAANAFWDRNINNIDDVLVDGVNFIVEKNHETLLLCIQNLMNKGIDDVDIDMLVSKCPDRIDPTLGLDFFYRKADEIEDLQDKLAEYRNIKRTSRGHWQGGGFGLKGAFKGAITAGMLNAGSSFIHGIGDSITDSTDKKKLEDMKCAAIKDPNAKNIFSSCVENCCLGVGDGYYKVLLEKSLASLIDLDTQKEEARFNNYKELNDRTSQISAAISLINKNPFRLNTYVDLYFLEPSLKTDLVAIAKYFQLDSRLEDEIRKSFNDRLTAINMMPENTKVEIEDKITALKATYSDAGGLLSEAEFNSELSRLESDKEKKTFDEAYVVRSSHKEENDNLYDSRLFDQLLNRANDGDAYAASLYMRYYLREEIPHYDSTKGKQGAWLEDYGNFWKTDDSLVKQYIAHYAEHAIYKMNQDQNGKIICDMAEKGLARAIYLKGYWAAKGIFNPYEISENDAVALIEKAANMYDINAPYWAGVIFRRSRTKG